jgi:hypothetical protein
MTRESAIALLLVTMTSTARAQAPDELAQPGVVEPSTASAPTNVAQSTAPPIQVEGCPERLDARGLRARVALELSSRPRPGLVVGVHVGCDSREARVTVLDRGRPVTESRVDLGEATGVARAWALAIVVADLVRRPRAVPSTTPASIATRTLDSPAERERAEDARARVRGPVERPSTPAASVESMASESDEALGATIELPTDDRAGAPARRAPTWLTLGAAGRITFDGPTAVAGISVALRHDWVRAGLLVGGTHRGNALGGIAAGLVILDLAAAPLRHADPGWSLDGELFVHGGLLYGAGVPAAASVHASDALAGLIGGGLGARLHVGPASSAGLDLGIRAGYEPLGAELRTAFDALVRVHGFFASVEVGLTLPVD